MKYIVHVCKTVYNLGTMSNPSRPVSGFVPLGDVAGEVERPDGRVLTPRAAAGQVEFWFRFSMNRPLVVRTSFRFDLDSEKRGHLGHVIAVDHNHGRPAIDHRPCARRQYLGEFAGRRHRVARPDHEFLVPRVQEPQRVLLDVRDQRFRCLRFKAPLQVPAQLPPGSVRAVVSRQ